MTCIDTIWYIFGNLFGMYSNLSNLGIENVNRLIVYLVCMKVLLIWYSEHGTLYYYARIQEVYLIENEKYLNQINELKM